MGLCERSALHDGATTPRVPNRPGRSGGQDKAATGSSRRAGGLEKFSSNFSSEFPIPCCYFLLPFACSPIRHHSSSSQELSSQRERERERERERGCAWFLAPRSSLNWDTLDRSDDEEEQSRCATTTSRLVSRFGQRPAKRRSGSQQHLLLMDCVGGSDNGDAAEETVPLPDYERLSQSARLPDDPEAKDPPPPLTPVQQQQTPAKREAASPPQPPPTQQQKPAAWRLIEYVRSRHRAAGGGGAAGGCGVGSDGDSKSSDGEREGEDGGKEGKKDKKKKRSSWLPDPDRRWPVQGFY